MKISVIIPTYNRAPLLDLTLNSYTMQKITQDLYELVIIDDGSSDNTKEVVDSYANRGFPINYVYLDNPGWSNCAPVLNVGIKQSTGNVILVSSSDVITVSNTMEQHLSYHDGVSPVVVTGRCYNISDSFDLTLNLKDKDVIRQAHDNYIGTPCIGDYGPTSEWVVGFSTSLLKNIVIEMGGFDERFKFWGWEDLDFGDRLQAYGCKFISAREIRNLHYPHDHSDDSQHQSKASLDTYQGIANSRPHPYKANIGLEWGVIK